MGMETLSPSRGGARPKSPEFVAYGFKALHLSFNNFQANVLTKEKQRNFIRRVVLGALNLG